MSGYKRLLSDTRPSEGDDVIYNVIVVVFTDLLADRAQDVFDDVLKHLAVPSYAKAIRRLRCTTRASDHSSRPCRFCS
jgi:hypothetical protein